MTKFNSYLLITLILTVLSVPHAGAGIVERNAFLTEMLSLAEKQGYYFLVSTGENQIAMMTRGITIREWHADEIYYTGKPLPITPIPLESKSVDMAALRSSVDIEDNRVEGNTPADTGVQSSDNNTGKGSKNGKYELVAMEIDDMPGDYQLFLKGGITVNVTSGAEGPDTLYLFKRYAWYPILTLWESFNKITYTKIDIFFKDKTEAQALFWTLNEGTDCIILPARSDNKEDFQF